jgi:hypothetical protein
MFAPVNVVIFYYNLDLKGGRRYVLTRLEFPHFCGYFAAYVHEQILAVELPELSSALALAR